MTLKAVRDELAEELLVTLLVGGDPADKASEHRLVDLGLEVAQVDGVGALVEGHEDQGLDLGVLVGPVAAHHMVDAGLRRRPDRSSR